MFRYCTLPIVQVLAALAGEASADTFKVSVPVACDLGRTCFVQNYVDLDPGKSVRTADCGQASYDGHKGTDFRLMNTGEHATVLAAAPGQVRALRNDMPDRLVRSQADRLAVRDRECGNGVVLTHDDGWETQYCHLRQGSVSVAVGDVVQRGQALGEVGYSGLAAFAHVHLTVRKDGETVDPFLGTAERTKERAGACAAASAPPVPQQAGLWTEPEEALLRDAGGTLIEVGFAGRPVDTRQLETGQVARPAAAAPALVFFARLINLKPGDRIALELTGPDGLVASTEGKPMDRHKAQWVAFAGRKSPPGGWPAGTYTGEAALVRAGKVLQRTSSTFKLVE